MTFYGISPVNLESVSAVTSDPSVELGTRRHEAGCDYIYVYNCNDSKPLYPSRGCYPRTASSGYSVTVTNTAAKTGSLAGVCQHATIPSNYYGWIMIKGLAYVSPDTNAVSWASGQWLVVGADDGFVTATVTQLVACRTVGYAITSGTTITTTNENSSFGKAWIRSDIW